MLSVMNRRARATALPSGVGSVGMWPTLVSPMIASAVMAPLCWGTASLRFSSMMQPCARCCVDEPGDRLVHALLHGGGDGGGVFGEG